MDLTKIVQRFLPILSGGDARSKIHDYAKCTIHVVLAWLNQKEIWRHRYISYYLQAYSSTKNATSDNLVPFHKLWVLILLSSFRNWSFWNILKYWYFRKSVMEHMYIKYKMYREITFVIIEFIFFIWRPQICMIFRSIFLILNIIGKIKMFQRVSQWKTYFDVVMNKFSWSSDGHDIMKLILDGKCHFDQKISFSYFCAVWQNISLYPYDILLVNERIRVLLISC